MERKVRVAAIGLGWVTTNRHLPSMKENPKYEIVGVIDRKPGRAREIAAKYMLPHYHEGDSLENIAWLDKIDAVTLGTSPHVHHAFIKSALNLGKHVLTEKPFTMTVAEGEELVKLAESKKKILSIVHNFQFASSAQKLIADTESGKLGKIRSIAVQQLSNPSRRLPVWYEELPLGLFYDESPHFFYLLLRLAPGPLKLLKCHSYPNAQGMQTPAVMDVHYACEGPQGKIPVVMHLNFEATLSEWHITVHGEKAVGDIDIFRDIYIRLPNDGLHTTATVIRTSILATAQHWAQHFTSGIKHLAGTLRFGNDRIFDLFADAVLNGQEPQWISAQHALKILKMQHEVLSNQIKY